MQGRLVRLLAPGWGQHLWTGRQQQGRLLPLLVPSWSQTLWLGLRQQQGRLLALLAPGWSQRHLCLGIQQQGKPLPLLVTQHLWLGTQQQGKLLPLLLATCSLQPLHPPLLGGARVLVGRPAQPRLLWTHARCSCRPSSIQGITIYPQQVRCCMHMLSAPGCLPCAEDRIRQSSLLALEWVLWP